MSAVPDQGDSADAKARLAAEHPDWNIICSDRGRWWANRGPLVAEKLSDRATVDADTPEDLAEKIRAMSARKRVW